MDSKDIRNLQEAYSNVYQEVDEAKVDFTAGRGPFANDEYPGEGSPQDKGVKSAIRKIDNARTKAGHTAKFGPRAKAAAQGRRQLGVLDNVSKKDAAESYDLYDVILSHLLDEGYADTQESALAIMGNMSEDWRESIVEAKVDFTAGRGPFANDEYPGEGSPQDKGVKSAIRKIDNARTKAGHTAKFGPRAKAAAQGRRQLGVLDNVSKRERSS